MDDAFATTVRLVVELDREEDGRWIAEVPSLPGVMAYGDTRELAIDAVNALALRVIADRVERRVSVPSQVLAAAPVATPPV